MPLRFAAPRGTASVVLNSLVRGPTGATGATGAAGADGDMTGPGVSVDSEIALYSGTGGATLKRATGSGFVATVSGVHTGPRTLTAPAAGITITNPAGAAGDPTFALADDLAAVEGISATGIVRRTASNTWSAGTLATNAELADMADSTIKGRSAGSGTGAPEDLTATQATAILNVFGADSGSGGVKGLVPATVAGDATKFLRGDATWVAGGGDLLAANNLSDVASTTTAFTNIKQAASDTATGVVELATTAEAVTGTDTSRAVTCAGVLAAIKGLTREFILSASDETTALTTGTAKVSFRLPRAITLTGVRASLSTAQSSGSAIAIDINEGGVSVLSTVITIDNGEKTSTTAATPAVISDTSLADDAEITVDIDTVGDGTAKGLKVTLLYTIP